MLVKKTFYLVKLHKVQIPIHSKGMNFITHFIPKSFFRHAKTTHSIPNKKKKKKILVKVYNILSNYIPITFTYPFHTNTKKKNPFHYTFKGHELHTYFITIHSKGVSHSFHYIPIQRAWLHTHSLQFIHYPFRTQNNDE